MRFRDREQAGSELAKALAECRIENPIVIAVPRGGIPVGYEVARVLGAPMDSLIVGKIGAPFNPEYAIGAVAENGTVWLDHGAISTWNFLASDFDFVTAQALQELKRKIRLYRSGRPALPVAGRSVIIVDDGMATGATVSAAFRSTKKRRPLQVIVAVPVSSKEAVERLRAEADQVVCLSVAESLRSVSEWYDDFRPVDDEQALELLDALGAMKQALM